MPKLLADDCEWLRSRHMRQGMPKAATDAHMSVLGNEAALEAALAWYRSSGPRQPLGRIKVPTLYLWGDADDTVGRVAAEGTGEFIDAPYRFEVLPGVGHYAATRSRPGQRAAAGAPRASMPADQYITSPPFGDKVAPT